MEEGRWRRERANGSGFGSGGCDGVEGYVEGYVEGGARETALASMRCGSSRITGM